jgi:hypothetical protein
MDRILPDEIVSGSGYFEYVFLPYAVAVTFSQALAQSGF